jgi:exodeoxyribonuclease VIII
MTTQFTDIMVDLETLGTAPDSAIISIAAIPFDLRTGEADESNVFMEHIDVASNLQAGRVVNPNTLSWWIDNNGEVFAKWCRYDKIPLHRALQYFKDWLVSQSIDLKSYQIWGNSNRFDLGILDHAYGHNSPWHFSCERDVRTLAMFDEACKDRHKAKFVENGFDLHNPVTDCLIQISYCSEIYNTLKPSLDSLSPFTGTTDTY